MAAYMLVAAAGGDGERRMARYVLRIAGGSTDGRELGLAGPLGQQLAEVRELGETGESSPAGPVMSGHRAKRSET